jgi:hypothetical protein
MCIVDLTIGDKSLETTTESAGISFEHSDLV